MLTLDHISKTFNPGTINEKRALDGLTLHLNPGDFVVFTDADGNIFSYEVAEIETVGGYDIEKMEAGDWDLTLFTCTNKGKARAAVRCREIEK